ncbi:hypothetical protein [uncultured Polaribacter sp.]|uniref:hypothetical protein n=1 Tax=uncultured Polaribacter sp. TaxID=174711 RepID=UPI002607EB7E|nr:hypothetical protein [uncultured Polaribacter sp.]
MKKIILITLTVFLNLSLLSCSESDDFDIENNTGTEVLNSSAECCDGNGEILPPPPPPEEDGN